MSRHVIPIILVATMLVRLTVSAWAQPAVPAAATEDAGQIPLTAEERAWIAAHPVIRVGQELDYIPYCFRNAEGKLVGMDINLLELLSRRTGLRFETEVRPEWGQVMEEFKFRRIDALMGLSPIPGRQNIMTYTKPYFFSSVVVIVRDGTDYILQPADLAQRRVGLPVDYSGMHWTLKEAAPTAIVVDYNGMEEVLRALAAGEIDATISDLANGAYLIKSLRLSNLRIGSVFGESSGNYFGVRPDWPELTGIINKVFEQLTVADRRLVIGNWIVPLEPVAWWRSRAFQNAASIAGVTGLVALLMLFYNRRLAAELTERRRIQLQLEEAHAQLARVSEEKSELMHMVAHDLRSPLTGIGMGAEILQAENSRLSAPSHDILVKMIDATGRMRRMVDDLVDVHMIEAGRHEYESVAVDFGGLLREAVLTFSETAVRKSIRLEVQARQPVMALQTDPRALRQVVDNLISNALKYSPTHTVVQVELLQTGGHCQLRVCDQGPGVKPEEREKIFGKYGRGSALTTGGEKSIGLGLWIVRRIVTDLHGRVWCEAGPGAVGSVFVVELPLAPPAAT